MSDEIYNLKDMISESRLKEMIVESFAKNFKLDKEMVMKNFDHLIDKKINEIGKNFNESKQTNFGKIDNMSSDDFFNKQIKIIKDE